jgi:hypothetical protein
MNPPPFVSKALSKLGKCTVYVEGRVEMLCKTRGKCRTQEPSIRLRPGSQHLHFSRLSRDAAYTRGYSDSRSSPLRTITRSTVHRSVPSSMIGRSIARPAPPPRTSTLKRSWRYCGSAAIVTRRSRVSSVAPQTSYETFGLMAAGRSSTRQTFRQTQS